GHRGCMSSSSGSMRTAGGRAGGPACSGRPRRTHASVAAPTRTWRRSASRPDLASTPGSATRVSASSTTTRRGGPTVSCGKGWRRHDADRAALVTSARDLVHAPGRMEFGLFVQAHVPRHEVDADPDHAEHSRLMRELELAEACDRSGWKYVWSVEHHFLEE